MHLKTLLLAKENILKTHPASEQKNALLIEIEHLITGLQILRSTQSSLMATHNEPEAILIQDIISCYHPIPQLNCNIIPITKPKRKKMNHYIAMLDLSKKAINETTLTSQEDLNERQEVLQELDLLLVNLYGYMFVHNHDSIQMSVLNNDTKHIMIEQFQKSGYESNHNMLLSDIESYCAAIADLTETRLVS